MWTNKSAGYSEIRLCTDRSHTLINRQLSRHNFKWEQWKEREKESARETSKRLPHFNGTSNTIESRHISTDFVMIPRTSIGRATISNCSWNGTEGKRMTRKSKNLNWSTSNVNSTWRMTVEDACLVMIMIVDNAGKLHVYSDVINMSKSAWRTQVEVESIDGKGGSVPRFTFGWQGPMSSLPIKLIKNAAKRQEEEQAEKSRSRSSCKSHSAAQLR